MRKLAFIRCQGYGNRTWDSPRYFIPGVSPSHSIYDQPELETDTGLYAFDVGANVQTERGRRAAVEPTMNRNPRIGAQFSSLAALPVFQSGWQVRWSDGMLAGLSAAPPKRTLAQNFNPNQPGSKEQQRATVYNPWPSFGALAPKAI